MPSVVRTQPQLILIAVFIALFILIAAFRGAVDVKPRFQEWTVVGTVDPLPFPAFVISLDASSPRFRRTKSILQSMGFQKVVQIAPRIYEMGNSASRAVVEHRACSNKDAHR